MFKTPTLMHFCSLCVYVIFIVLWILLCENCYCAGDQPGADLGPLISPQAKQWVCDLVQSGVDEGATVSGWVE